MNTNVWDDHKITEYIPAYFYHNDNEQESKSHSPYPNMRIIASHIL